MTIDIDNPAERLELSPIPNIKQPAGAARWIAENLGIEVTERYIHKKTVQRKIAYSLIGGRRHYSTLALYEFIMSCNKTDEKSTTKPTPDPWAV